MKNVAKNGVRYWYFPSNFYLFFVSKVDFVSLLGELTDIGRVSTLSLGQRIRKLYVDQLGFLPKTLEDENTLYMRYVILKEVESGGANLCV